MYGVIIVVLLAGLGASDAPQPIERQPFLAPPDACYRDFPVCRVGLEFTILPSGEVTNVRILEQSKQRPCDAAATSSVKKWRFPKRDETARFHQSFEFNLCSSLRKGP